MISLGRLSGGGDRGERNEVNSVFPPRPKKDQSQTKKER